MTPDEKKPDCTQFDCPLGPSATNILQSLARIEENQLNLKKHIEGNGRPGLLSRVSDLEAVSNTNLGKDTMRKVILGVVVTFSVALMGFFLNDYSALHKAQAGFAAADLALSYEIKAVKTTTDHISQKLDEHDQKVGKTVEPVHENRVK